MDTKKSSAKNAKKHPIKRFFIATLGNERWQGLTIPIFAVLLSLIAVSIVLLAIGKNPLEAFKSLLQGSGLWAKGSYAQHKSVFTDFMALVNAWTPMIFAALAVAVAFKAGLFNIGVSGQMLIAGFAATVLVGYSGLSAFVAKPLVLLIGIIAGGLVGALIGFLKYKFNTNEVVASIMINYILQYVISFMIFTNYIDPVSRQSKQIKEAARLTLMNREVGNLKMDIPLGIIIALLVALLMYVFLARTRMGYEIKTVGTNPKAATYAGMSVSKNIMLAMTISGALAGLAGVSYYLGYFGSIQPRTLADLGFDSIAVSLLGNSHPIGIIFASFFITILTRGSTYMSSSLGVQQEIGSLIVGLILLFSACSSFIKYLVKRMQEQIEDEEELSKQKSEAGEVGA